MDVQKLETLDDDFVFNFLIAGFTTASPQLTFVWLLEYESRVEAMRFLVRRALVYASVN